MFLPKNIFNFIDNDRRSTLIVCIILCLFTSKIYIQAELRPEMIVKEYGYLKEIEKILRNFDHSITYPAKKIKTEPDGYYKISVKDLQNNKINFVELDTEGDYLIEISYTHVWMTYPTDHEYKDYIYKFDFNNQWGNPCFFNIEETLFYTSQYLNNFFIGCKRIPIRAKSVNPILNGDRFWFFYIKHGYISEAYYYYSEYDDNLFMNIPVYDIINDEIICFREFYQKRQVF